MTADNFASPVAISGGTVQGFIYENHGTVTQNFIYQVSELLRDPPSGSAQVLNQQDYRQRRVLLSKVKAYWIEGVLSMSLQTEAMIELGLEERSDAVERPFSSFEASPTDPRPLLPANTGAAEFFNQMGDGRTLLILGEPGAGKTVTLLKLAQNLIACTEQGLSHLVPVVLNLSSWGNKAQSLENWLIEELYTKYQVSKILGKTLIAEQQMLLLLDGLDEVRADRRDDCVQTINQFMQEHGQTEMVVCSRIADYEALSNRLHLLGSIFIRALTPEQVNLYLDRMGEKLQAIKTVLQEDPVLQELAKSPLTLNVMTLAYQGKSVDELRQTDSIDDRRRSLFNTYIQRMFKQEIIGKPSHYQPPYGHPQTLRWLTWLAQRLSQTSNSIFLIEQLQPTWLSSSVYRVLYRLGSAALGGLIVGSIATLMDTVIQALITTLMRQDGSAAGGNLLLHVILGLVSTGLIVGLMIGLGQSEIKTIPALKWSWTEAQKSLPQGLMFGLILGVVSGVLNLKHYVSIGVLVGLELGLLGGLIYCMTQGFKGANVTTTVVPNQGIWQSMRSAIILGIAGGFMGMGLFGLIMGISGGLEIIPLLEGSLVTTIIKALSFGWVTGTLFGAVFGGIGACAKHLTLRLILYSHRHIPWNYAHFLDYAAERILLQKVGGGYLFIHRTLLEHFVQG